jgi:hypothetical protein
MQPPVQPRIEAQPVPYRVESLEACSGGVEAVVKGPGIGAAGVRYLLESADEAGTLVDALNRSYAQGRFWRSLLADRRRRPAVRSGPVSNRVRD